MKNILYCRRTFIAALAICCLTALGILKDMDVAMALASVAIGLAGANSYEKASTAKATVQYGNHS